MRQKRTGTVRTTGGIAGKPAAVIETTRQYVFCPDRKNSPHVAIEVCRTRCGKYATCHAGGLDEADTPKKESKAKRVRMPIAPLRGAKTKPSALSRILSEDDSEDTP